jgi:hypothetical protein
VTVLPAFKHLVGAIVVGFGVIFAAKAREQHWSETPSVLVHEERVGDRSAGT